MKHRLPVYIMTASSKGHPYLLNKQALPAGHNLRTFIGKPLPEDWEPPAHLIKRKSASLADALLYETSFPLFSERATKVLGDNAPGCAEFRYFADVRGKPFFLMNVLASADILDEMQSEGTRSQRGERITITKHVFRPDRLDLTPPIFKLPGRFWSEIFVTDAIADAVVEERLTGFQFRDPAKNPMRDLFLGNDVNVVEGVLP
jgi:hypothetical protein